MTNFLPAGIIHDSIEDICEKIASVRTYYEQRDMRKLKDSLNELEEVALDLAVFLERLSCQPLIYTGNGTTEEIMQRLEWALTFSENVNPLELIQRNSETRKRNKI